MSGPVFKPLAPSKMTIDDPHKPYGMHVDLVTPFGQGAEKMRIGKEGQILTHEVILKGGSKFSV